MAVRTNASAYFLIAFSVALLCRLASSFPQAGSSVVDENEDNLYFTTDGGGLKKYSLSSGETKTVVSSDQVLLGVAYDWLIDKIYWSNSSWIFRANRDGTELETVFNATVYGTPYALSFDWISGKVYVATWNGFILACDGSSTKLPFTCATVLAKQGLVQGLAVDPVEGTMYWTVWSPGGNSSIRKAGMDGANPEAVVTTLGTPYGIAIDFISRRLYWTQDDEENLIRSSDLEGSDVQTIVQLCSGLHPSGVTVVRDRVYWGSWSTNKLESSSKSGDQIITHFASKNEGLRRLAVVPGAYLPKNRTNNCEGHECATVCALSKTSFRCLE